MMRFAVLSDGSCDLGPELAAEKNVHVVPFWVTFDGTNYQKEIEELPVRDFYQMMVDDPHTFPKTAQPAIQDMVEAFLPYAKEKMPVLFLTITTKFSGTYNAALLAADMVREEVPDAEICVLNSCVNTVTQGLAVLEACRMRDAGYTLSECVERLQKMIPTGRILFTGGNYDDLVKGGRIGKLMAAMVMGLNIRPLIILKEGEIFPGGIARGRKRSLEKVLGLLPKYFKLHRDEDPKDYAYVIGYGYDREEAVDFREKMKECLKELGCEAEIRLCQIGAAISAHTGPYALGIGLMRKYDTFPA